MAYACVAISYASDVAACDWVETLAHQTGSDLPAGAVCSDPPDAVCHWSFDYRSAAAEDAFDTIQDRLSACLGSTPVSDAPVNHPDSYRLVQYEKEDALISLSLKDKASRQQSFVFLRVDNLSE